MVDGAARDARKGELGIEDLFCSVSFYLVSASELHEIEDVDGSCGATSKFSFMGDVCYTRFVCSTCIIKCSRVRYSNLRKVSKKLTQIIYAIECQMSVLDRSLKRNISVQSTVRILDLIVQSNIRIY